MVIFAIIPNCANTKIKTVKLSVELENRVILLNDIEHKKVLNSKIDLNFIILKLLLILTLTQFVRTMFKICNEITKSQSSNKFKNWHTYPSGCSDPCSFHLKHWLTYNFHSSRADLEKIAYSFNHTLFLILFLTNSKS